MLRVLPVLIAVVLAVYCLVDLTQRRGQDVRYVPRWAWALIVIAVPIVGPIGWLLAGRPAGPSGGRATPSQGRPHPVAPDDDPEFLDRLRQRRQRETDERLRRWEQELEERERELKRRDDDGPAGSGGSTGPTQA